LKDVFIGASFELACSKAPIAEGRWRASTKLQICVQPLSAHIAVPFFHLMEWNERTTGVDIQGLPLSDRRLTPHIARYTSSELCSDRPKAGCEDIISDLRDDRITVSTDYFEIGPPFRKRPIAMGDPLQSDPGDVATNRQCAFDNLISKRVVPIVQAN
jgi:hypothetical protein